MNKETAVKRVNGIGKAGTIISRIAMVFLIIGIVGCLVSAMILSVLPKDFFEFNVVGSGNMEIHIDKMLPEAELEKLGKAIENGEMNVANSSYASEEVIFSEDGRSILVDVTGDSTVINPGRVALVLWSALLYVVGTLVVVIFVEKLCKAFRDCKTPFEENIIKALQRLAWSLIPWLVLGSTLEGCISSAFKENVDIRLGVNLQTALVILLIFGLSYIFKYGAVLQQESDETL